MRRMIAVLIVLSLAVVAGCSLHDALFGLFGTYHSDGYSRDEREQNYDRRVDAARQATP